ncbi:hypothetical protein KY310_02505 [Candidatus Woesearchaeota archaeon]|nr:hypothetical protein [Candidatus Woesearchaeota archaeon]
MGGKKLQIGIDCDEPLADFNSVSCPWHNASYGSNITKEDITTYRMWLVWNCPVEEFNKRVIEFYESEEFNNVLPTAGAVESTQALAEAGHEMIVITSRFGPAVEKTVPWLDKHFPGKFSKVIFAQNYSIEGIHKTKAEICEEEKVDILIEDCLQYALECHEKGIPVILFDCPWNGKREMQDSGLECLPSGIVRAKDWKQVVALIDIIKKDKEAFYKL